MSDYVVAMIGNPNSGKSTLFNVVTGARQKVGNWPGVTVERKTGSFLLEGEKVELVDLPGIYSLEQASMGLDEKIALEFLENNKIDLIINILDASNLERNLVLTQQLLERDIPIIVALNMLDVAEHQGIRIDAAELENRLGVPIAPLVASRGTGFDHLHAHMILELLERPAHSDRLKKTIQPEDSSAAIIQRLKSAAELTRGVVTHTNNHQSLTERIDRWVLHRWLAIPVFLLMIYLMFTFAINLGAVFIDFFDILFGAIFVDAVRWVLTGANSPDWLITLLADGLGGGIQLVATFIPVIGFLYLCLSLLEDSGYLSRAAFVVDRLMSKLGLPGTAFVPLIVGFGCNVPSVMAARSLGKESDRLLTIAMAPFMSCGARLTVYALFATAFFPSNGQNLVFLLYLLGIGMAVATGYIFRKQVFSGDKSPSFQEMPAYHIPVLRNILLTTWFRLRAFVFRAGKTIVLVFVVLSFLNSLGTDGSFGHQDSRDSALAKIGQTITPLFTPIGIAPDNWPATVGLFTGVFAKEAVVGTLDALYSGPSSEQETGPPELISAFTEATGTIIDNTLQLFSSLNDPLGIGIGEVADQELAASNQGVQSITITNMGLLFGSAFSAFCYLVFVLLYAPCAAVLGAISREAGARWMILVFVWTLSLAYITAGTIYQLGTLLEHPAESFGWLLLFMVIGILGIFSLKTLGRRAIPDELIPVVQL